MTTINSNASGNREAIVIGTTFSGPISGRGNAIRYGTTFSGPIRKFNSETKEELKKEV